MVIWIFVSLPMYSTKLAPWLTFRWWIGGNDPVHQICMQAPHCQVPSVARHALTWHWLWYDIRECIRSEHFSEGVCPGLKQCIWWHCWCNSCWSHRSCAVFCLCVNWHPQPRIVPNYTCVKRESQLGWWLFHRQVRTCWWVSCKTLCCNPHESSNTAKAASTGSVCVRLG